MTICLVSWNCLQLSLNHQFHRKSSHFSFFYSDSFDRYYQGHLRCLGHCQCLPTYYLPGMAQSSSKQCPYYSTSYFYYSECSFRLVTWTLRVFCNGSCLQPKQSLFAISSFSIHFINNHAYLRHYLSPKTK